MIIIPINILSKEVGIYLKPEEFEHSLENMQAKVGGYIEALGLPNDITMWLDDEGLLKEKPLNLVIVRDSQILNHIVGDVFFTGTSEEGDTVGLSNEQATWIIENTKLVGESKTEEGITYPVYGIILD